MKARFVTLLSVVITLLAIAACGGAPVAPSAVPGQAAVTAPVSTGRSPVRLAGELAGQTYQGPVGSCPGSGRAQISEATGPLTHLGLASVRSQHCYVGYNADGSLRYVGTAVVVAADGDEMRVNYSGSMRGLAGPPAPGAVLTGTGAMAISGGTDRFSDASGEGTIGVEVIFSGLSSPIRLNFAASFVY